VEHNPYQPPTAAVSDPPDQSVPDSILRDIRNGWIAAVVSGSVTLVYVVVAIYGVKVYGITAWELVDVGLVFALAYGIYRRSRVCAVLLIVYFVYAKAYLLLEGAPASSLVIGAIFLYFYVRAALAAFRYHRLLKA
jgi:hypothetical protein